MNEFNMPVGGFDKLRGWADGIECAVTICDADCKILYMNERSRATFARHGDLIGHDLMACHSEKSREMIKRMLATGVTNAYTISKGGVRKLIFQTPWRCDGEVAGLVEISIVLPENMPHYDRLCRN